MAVLVKKKRLYNPQRKLKTNGGKPSAKRKTHQKRNPGELITLGMLNPQRSAMKKKSKKSKTAAPKRPNPLAFKKRAAPKTKPKRRHGRIGNPSRTMISQPVDAAKAAAVALGGLVVARQVPQMALGAKNMGWIGYLANFGTALATGAVVGRWDRSAGWMAAIGGTIYTLSRVLTEQLSPIGKYFALTGVGDATAAGMGDLREGYYPVPVVYDDDGRPQIPRAIVDAVRSEIQPAAGQPAAASNTNMSGLERYRYGR